MHQTDRIPAGKGLAEMERRDWKSQTQKDVLLQINYFIAESIITSKTQADILKFMLLNCIICTFTIQCVILCSQLICGGEEVCKCYHKLIMKEFSTDLSFHSCNTVTLMIDSLKIDLYCSKHSCPSSKPGAYITHNATRPLIVVWAIGVCYASSGSCSARFLSFSNL